MTQTRAWLILALAACLPGCGPDDGGPDQKQENLFYYDFEEIVASVKTETDRPRHVRATFRFEISGSDKKEAVQAIEDNARVIRDGLIVFLSTESVKDFSSKETHGRIRTEACKIANSHLDEPYVKRVILKSLVLQ